MSKPVRPSAARLAIAFILPLAVILAVYYASGGKIGGDALQLRATTPEDITLASERTTPLALTVELTNRGGDVQRFSVGDPCKVLRWVIQAPGEATVQSRGDQCLSVPTDVSLASGETLQRSETLMLDNARYTPGVTYTVYVDFYGVVAKTDFTVAGAP